MRALVIYCHPVSDSFCAAMRDAAVQGLERAGHVVNVIDLSAENFNPVMSREEWNSYRSLAPTTDAEILRHIQILQNSEILVFVYPTWWSSMPAQLKGWLERVLLPDVAFRFNKRNKVRPALTNVRKIIVISTFGSPRWYVHFIHDNGKRVLSRALRISTGWSRVTALALYAMDTQTQRNRSDFLQKISDTLARS